MSIPIKQLYLYKHGIGFIKRRGTTLEDKVILEFDKSEINDVLKSLSIVDHSGKMVLGVDYDTPEEKASLLQKTLFQDNKEFGIQSILNSCRGKKVILILKDGSNIVGIFTAWQSTISTNDIPTLAILKEDYSIDVIALKEVHTIQVQDNDTLKDLSYFLDLVNSKEHKAGIMIRLERGEHDIEISYTSPAPTWKMSYRVNTISETKLVLSGWCIFENTYNEDLNDVELTLTSGMPISFIFQLYKSNLPERMQLKEEDRTIKTPIEFEGNIVKVNKATTFGRAFREEYEDEDRSSTMREAELRVMKEDFDEVEYSPDEKLRRELIESRYETDVFSDDILGVDNMPQPNKPEKNFEGHNKEEFFEYKIAHPISVCRGKSAMIPLFSSEIEYKKELIYNHSKFPLHPVFVLRFSNTTGYILESGPVTVLEKSEYSGESILRISQDGSASVLSYAIDLSVPIKQEYSTKEILSSVYFEQGNFISRIYKIIITTYSILNKSKTTKKLLIEHKKTTDTEVFDTIPFQEETINEYRFSIDAKPSELTYLVIQERKLLEDKESILHVKYENFQKLLKANFLSEQVFERLKPIFVWKQEIMDIEEKISDIIIEKRDILDSQENLRQNIVALADSEIEKDYRKRIVETLISNEEQINQKENQIKELKQKAIDMNQHINEYIKEFKNDK